MKQFLLLILIFSLSMSICFAGNAVKLKSTGEIVYRQVPDFEEGKGIISAAGICGYDQNELEEITLESSEFNKISNDKIKAEKDKIKAAKDSIKQKLSFSDKDLKDLREALRD